ncbi:glycosyltransferase [Bacillus paranthracis]|uniref:Glycosyltransferase n=2 Tax=Bacillus paranthracis TaxID=2026186 RepID=A0AAJ1NMU4_9BACI|nr:MULTISPECIES: glycosyltransferase [Bacillus]ADY22234.1 glycosyl transferase, group 2 family protein [Bacillus thuringiensis serovar finitimus YBT-020]MDA1584876.1 glycosyltransferase [Bacillus cereus group sp. TH230-1LC]MRC71115.1 glycosyltransferase [Bacillus thuringiensis]OTX69798.1 glycosyl transferase [Bacillus thuringiensis serovar finitimus]MCR6797565.1 glycosyltransferase [Bacillus paranthracis]
MCKNSISIIIPIRHKIKNLPRILEACEQLQPLEIILTINGDIQDSIESADPYNFEIITLEEPIDSTNLYVIGAKKAKGQYLLFLDENYMVPPPLLIQFLQPLQNGSTDVVLNNLDDFFYQKQQPNIAMIWQQVTNHFFHRPDLHVNSLLFPPYAMTKEVLDVITPNSLSNPILAQMKIIEHKFRICDQFNISIPQVPSFPSTQLIHYHLEAIANWINIEQNPRGNYTDNNRRRDIILELQNGEQRAIPKIITGKEFYSNTYGNKQLSIIIPVQNEEKTIESIIFEVQKLKPFEIIVIVNGSTDKTEELAKGCGATVISYEEALGIDTGRAVGAYFAKGDILLFIDGDFLIPSSDLLPFVQSIQNGADLALNKLEHYYMYRLPYTIVTACKYAVNLACNRKDLGMGSTTAVPHAFSRKCIDTIGFDSLLSPTLSQVKTILAGFHVQNVHSVDVDKLNRVRPEKHFSKEGCLSLATQQIIGDHIEAISYLIEQKEYF